MKTANFAKGLLLGASLLLASAAFAGEKATLKLYENVTINGKTLPAGKYDVAWEGSGSNVQLSIRQGKETLATLPAQVETTPSAPTASGYSAKKEDNGSRELTNIFFAGKKYTINLGQQAATSAQATTAGNK